MVLQCPTTAACKHDLGVSAGSDNRECCMRMQQQLQQQAPEHDELSAVSAMRIPDETAAFPGKSQQAL